MAAPAPLVPTLANANLERQFLYGPEEAEEAERWRERWLETATRVTYPTASLNAILSPMLPMEVTTLLARTGNSKTTFALTMALHQAERLRTLGSSEMVLYVTWEEGIDKLEHMVRLALMQRAGGMPPEAESRRQLPLYFIGYSMQRSNESQFALPPLTLDIVERLVSGVISPIAQGGKGLRPSEIVFDYLQMIPSATGRNRTEEVGNVMEYSNRLAQTFATSVVCAVQSGRVTDDNKFGMPTLHDAQWSSVIEQRSVRMLALSRPIMQGQEGESITFLPGVTLPVNHNLLLAETLKDRNGKPRGRAVLHFEPDKLLLADMDVSPGADRNNGHRVTVVEEPLWEQVELE